ncbi:hypothetical protein [Plantactinospora sp. WMMB782]|uniref:hypothetical protein n=1 Tax=Plantactinospora sp. WMMB782 TaxID=3404121 RepID=UPI003B958D86
MTGQPTWATVCATGHRPQHLTTAERLWVRGELARIVVKLRDECGMTCGVSGMAIGTDLWWAAALVDAGVDLWAHVPFPQQPNPWEARNPDAYAEWHRLCRVAKRLKTYGGRYDVRTLHARNDGMLDVSAAVVAVWKRSQTTGGTASAVEKANRRGLPIIHLDPERQTVTLRSLTSCS